MIIWYHIEKDLIFTSSEVDAMFYSLQPLHWHKLMYLDYIEKDEQ